MKVKYMLIFTLIIIFNGCEKKEDSYKDNNTENISISEESVTMDISLGSENTATDVSLGIDHSVSSPTAVNDIVIETYNAYVDYVGDDGKNIKDIYGNNPNNPIFYLAQIDSDEIPEMIISTDIGTSDYYILSYKDGIVVSDVLPRKLYIDIDCKDSVISSYNSDIVGYRYITYKLNEEWQLEEQCSHVETISEDDNTGKNNLKELFYIDSEQVTDEEYYKYMKNLSDNDKDIDYGMSRIDNEDYYRFTKANLEKLRKGELN